MIREWITLNDTVLSKWTGTVEVQSDIGLFGLAIAQEVFDEAVTSGIDIADAATIIQHLIATITESLVTADSVKVNHSLFPVITESIAFNSVVAVINAINKSISETITLSDALGVGWGKSVSDTIDLADTNTILWWCMNNLAYSINLSDSTAGSFICRFPEDFACVFYGRTWDTRIRVVQRSDR